MRSSVIGCIKLHFFDTFQKLYFPQRFAGDCRRHALGRDEVQAEELQGRPGSSGRNRCRKESRHFDGYLFAFLQHSKTY